MTAQAIPTPNYIDVTALDLPGLTSILEELDALGCDVVVVEVAEALSCKFAMVPRGRRSLLVVWVEASEVDELVTFLEEAIVFETKHRRALVASLAELEEAGR